MNYSRLDIEKYLQGKMSDAEMHQLELAALKDPFLADAIDGFAEAEVQVSANHLQEIEEKIKGHRVGAKVVSLEKKSKVNLVTMISAAAILGCIALISFWVIKNQSTEKQISENIAVVNLDTATKKSVQENVTPNQNVENKTTTKNQSDIPSNNAIGNTSSTNNNNQSVNEIKGVEQSSVVAAKEETKSNWFKDEASLVNAEQTKSIAQDTVSKFYDVTANAKNQAPNYNFSNQTQQVANPRRGYSNDNTLNNNSNVINLNTIVVKKDKDFKMPEAQNIGNSKKKENFRVINYKLTKEDSLAVPLNGWDNYNEYLRTNSQQIAYLDTTKTEFIAKNSKTGEVVELEFDIDENGNATNVYVANGVSPTKDTAAINLLKNGPKWANDAAERKKVSTEKINLNQRKGKINIKFKEN